MRVSAVLALLSFAAPLAASPDDGAPAPPAAAPPAERLSVVVLDLQSTNATPETARLITDLVAVSLQRTRALQVLTSEDVRSVMAFEAERQTAGCDDVSCLAELAGALGAALVVHGSVGQLGELFVVNLNLFDSREARSVGRESAQVRDRAELPSAIDGMARRLVGGVVELPEAPVAEAPPASEPPPSSSPFLSPLFLGGAAVGALAGAGAVGLGLWALSIDGSLERSAGDDGKARMEERERGLGVLAGATALGVAAVVAVTVAAVPFFE